MTRPHHLLRRLQDKRQRQLPLPVRNERGEGRGEGHPTADAQASHNKNDPPLPSPLLPRREEREKPSVLLSVVRTAVSSVGIVTELIQGSDFATETGVVVEL